MSKKVSFRNTETSNLEVNPFFAFSWENLGTLAYKDFGFDFIGEILLLVQVHTEAVGFKK